MRECQETVQAADQGPTMSGTPDKSEPTLGRQLGLLGAMAAIPLAAALFALAAAALTEPFIEIDTTLRAFLLLATYWGLFAQFMLYAVSKGILVSRARDVRKPPEQRLAPFERSALTVFLIKMVRVESVFSAILLLLSLLGVFGESK